MATAKFNDLDDFLGELKLDAAGGEVDRLILRVVFRWQRSEPYPVHNLSLVASYATGGEAVRLEHRVGSFFPDSPEEKDVRALAAKHRERVEAVAAECGLSIRGGVFE